VGLRADLTVRRNAFEVAVVLEAVDGETMAIVGPNGAGKTTVLEALAGLLPEVAGTVELDGVRVEATPPDLRRVGVCFQEDLLFPTMSVLENVAFGPRARGSDARVARARAVALLRDLAPAVEPSAKPRTLSGGERRRVALARALATEPRLLLLDEPLAGVDVAARAQIRDLLRTILAGFDGVAVLVVHDPVDALTLADRVTVLEEGRQIQTGTPEEIRSSPRSAYAAELVGLNLFVGMLEPLPDGAARLTTDLGTITVAPEEPVAHAMRAVATLKPIDVALHAEEPEGSPRNVVRGRVGEVAIDGERARIRIDGRPPLTAEITAGSVTRLGLATGSDVWASFKAVEVTVSLTDEGAAPGTLSG
jgi:molybdate transport system ATP-binding protein